MPVTPEPSDIAIGQRVKFRRQEAGLTQAELGQKIGVSIQQIQKYETGRNRISATRLVEIAGLLKTRASELLGEGLAGDPDSSLLNIPGALTLLRAYADIPIPEHRKGLVAMARTLSKGEETQ